MPRRTIPGIFCVEGAWSANLRDDASLLPLLEFLRSSNKIRFIHLSARTEDGLVDLIRKWPQQQYRPYNIGYFGFHGEEGLLKLGRQRFTLEDLSEQLVGQCQGKIIYFGSCSVLNIPKARIERFRRATKAKCVIGYTKDVDWHASAAFDLLLFEALTDYQRMDTVERHLRTTYGGMARLLGFKMFYG